MSRLDWLGSLFLQQLRGGLHLRGQKSRMSQLAAWVDKDIDPRPVREANRSVFIAQLDQAIRAYRAGAPPWALFERRVRTPRAFWAGNICEIFSIALREKSSPS